MLRKVLLTLALLITTGAALFAQQGTLKGTVTDKSTGEPLPFVNVVIYQEGQSTQYKGATTDMDGVYTIRPLPPGKYDIQASYMGYKPIKLAGVPVAASGFSVGDIKMESTAIELDLDIEIVDYAIPLIDKGTPESGQRISADDIARMPVNNVDDVISTVAGVAYGGSTARGESNMVDYVDGVRSHSGTSSIPKGAIAEVQVILGGTPAKYGESIGGTRVITLKPPSVETIGNFSYEGQVNYLNNHRLEMFLSGPLFKRRGADGVERALIGYRLSGWAQTVGYGALGKSNRYYRLKEDKMNELLASPLYYNPATGSLNYSALFLRKDDFERVKTFDANRSWQAFVEGGLSFRFSENATLTLSGSYQYTLQNTGGGLLYILTDTYKQRTIGHYFNVKGDFIHRFPDVEGSTSNIKNIMYNITASYTRSSSNTFNPDHGDDFFRYGYVGRFTPSYRKHTALETSGIDWEAERITIEGISFEESLMETDRFTTDEDGNVVPIYATLYEQQRGLPVADSIVFTPNTSNPLSNYTSQMYDITRNMGFAPSTWEDISLYMGVLNGGSPSSIYSLLGGSGYANAGVSSSTYSKSVSNYFYVTAKASADIKGHQIEFGLQYDQAVHRGYSLNARGLWTAMRELTNTQIADFETIYETDADGNQIIGADGNPKEKYYEIDGDFYKFYRRTYVAGAHTTFDKNLRKMLQMEENGLNWIDVDNLSENQINNLSLSMFSADDLYRDGNSPLVSYYGYDKDGNIVRGKQNLEDYFNSSSRTLGAWMPIYMAGYIQDQFYFRDLIFNVGVRVDYFDGNQKVLKDPYLLYGGKKVNQVSGSLNPLGYHPSNIGSDYVVYVGKALTELEQNQEITGYRNGSTWYNAQGVEIANPEDIKGDNAQATPLRAATSSEEGAEINVNESFKDYEPQVVVMPRIAFSFPVSDNSQFKASYDIIARRPAGAWQAPYYEYLMAFKNQSTTPVFNPDLKPEKITNYEVSFQQVLSRNSAITVAAYYKETRDLISVIQLAGADPFANLFTYGNVNYKTTKGVSISFDLRRTKNIRLGANYTLQYAEGTALPTTIMQSLMIQGYPNLKLLNPISDDRRHELKLDFDFRYFGGKDYNGPTTTRKVIEDGVEKSKTTRWLENSGINIQFITFSGTPYTKVLSHTQSTIVGDYQGSRLPWQFHIRMQLDKSWLFRSSNNKVSTLTAYARVENILNIKNILAVYRVTGDPENDGYLTDPDVQSNIQNQIDELSYRDLYNIMLSNNSYSYYSSPRVITLGVSYSF